MLGLTSEIIDKVSFTRRDHHLHPVLSLTWMSSAHPIQFSSIIIYLSKFPIILDPISLVIPLSTSQITAIFHSRLKTEWYAYHY